MTTATLTAKGQATIPKTVRNHFGLKSGDKLDFIIEPDGGVTIRPVNIDALRVAGLRVNRYAAAGIKDMDGQVLQENLHLNAYSAPSADVKPHTVSAIEYLLSLPAGDSTPEAVMARIEHERDAWH
ncbi:MAG: AbrB/MazE/SpoVT family DNA-binding domain-containing protein [Sulfuricellaceae bacterium]